MFTVRLRIERRSPHQELERKRLQRMKSPKSWQALKRRPSPSVQGRVEVMMQSTRMITTKNKEDLFGLEWLAIPDDLYGVAHPQSNRPSKDLVLRRGQLIPR